MSTALFFSLDILPKTYAAEKIPLGQVDKALSDEKIALENKAEWKQENNKENKNSDESKLKVKAKLFHNNGKALKHNELEEKPK